jgi:hypothetical protein
MIEVWLPRTEAEVNFLKRYAADKLNEHVDIFHNAYAYGVIEASEDGAFKKVLCAIVLSHATKYDMTISFAKESDWLMAPKMAKKLIDIAFGQPWRPTRLTSLVDEANDVSLSLQKYIGFIQEGRLRNFFGDRDAIMLGLLAEDWFGGD